MEFRFNVNDLFKSQPLIEINQTLIPPGFNGDRRGLWDAVTKVSEIVNAIGEASASAQGLTKPITTAERLRNSEHKLYLLIDPEAQNGKGVISGMLKTGKKSLYVFDREGHHHQVQTPCILDFYVHESRQRSGLGKHLFEHMLKKEDVQPVKLAIDRPSDKFLAFLNKHYSLNNGIKQMNNYVVFDGFFPEMMEKNTPQENESPSSPMKIKQSANGLQTNYSSTYGRYGAPRPPCSMGQIIHNQSSTVTKANEPSGINVTQNTTNSERPNDQTNVTMANLQSQSQGSGNPILTNQMQENPVPPEYTYQYPLQQQSVYAQPQPPRTIFNYTNTQVPVNAMQLNREIPPQTVPNYPSNNIPVQNYQIPLQNQQFNIANNQIPFVPQQTDQQRWQQQNHQQSSYVNQQQQPLQGTQNQETLEQSNIATNSYKRQENDRYSPCYPFTYANSTYILPVLNREHDSSQVPHLNDQLSSKSISKPSATKTTKMPSTKPNEEIEFQQNNLIKVPRVSAQNINSPTNQQQLQTHQQQIRTNEQQLQTNQQQLQSNQQHFQGNLQQLQPNPYQLQMNQQEILSNQQQLPINQPLNNVMSPQNQQQFSPMMQLTRPQTWQLNQQSIPQMNQQQIQQLNVPQTAPTNLQNVQLPQQNQQYNSPHISKPNTPINQLNSTTNPPQVNTLQTAINQQIPQYNPNNIMQNQYNQQQNYSMQNMQNQQYYPAVQQHNQNLLSQEQNVQNVGMIPMQNSRPTTSESRNPQYNTQAPAPVNNYNSADQITTVPNNNLTRSATTDKHPVQQNMLPNASGDMQPYTIQQQHQNNQMKPEVPQNPTKNEQSIYSSNQTTSQSKLNPVIEKQLPPDIRKDVHQHHQVNENAKLERPNSLSIQQSEEDDNIIITTTIEDVNKIEVNEKNDVNNVNDVIDGGAGIITINDNDAAIINDNDDNNTDDILKENDPIVSDTSAKLTELNVSPKADQTPSKKTPSHLTEQGFFDLKFYHNKLW